MPSPRNICEGYAGLGDSAKMMPSFNAGASVALAVLGLASYQVPAQAASLQQVAAIRLPGVRGRIDHLSFDPAGHRLFVAALGNNSVEVVDLREGRAARSLPGFAEPQGVCFVPEYNRLYVANGGDGSVRALDGSGFAEVARVAFDDDADNVRYEAVTKQLYVGHGQGAVGVVDVGPNKIMRDLPLSAHPESFQLESKGACIFVNLPQAHTVAVVDRGTGKVMAHWSLGTVAENFPLALDEAGHRAFIGCRRPARLLVYGTESGKAQAELKLHGDCDDIFYDPARRLVYAACGEGFLDIFGPDASGFLGLREAVPTAAGARTALFDGDRLYVAAPKRGGAEAKILVYEVTP